MNNTSTVPVIKDLVLIGGGHSHLSVLKYFAMHPMPGLRLTLITRDLHTPYSGMLPGYIAGHYSYDQAHIDLRPLAQFAQARIFHAEVDDIDLENRQIFCPGRPPISYDLTSINIGSRPGTLHIPGADKYTLPVKPIDSFLTRWQQLSQAVIDTTDKNFHLAIVGCGAGGVEMALATQFRLHQLLAQKNRDNNFLKVDLYCDSEYILPTHNKQVRKRFERFCKQRNIRIHTGQRIEEVQHDQLISRDGKNYPADATLWVTNASAPTWLAEAGLAVDEKGFIAVNDCLQSSSHKNIFAAGDIAAVINHPREKSGVFAVRQGPPLARNLERALQQKPLKKFTPQKNFLGLISTGDKYAIASRGNWSLEGAWLWKIKDWIDRRFMDNFNVLPEMPEEAAPKVNQAMVNEQTLHEISAIAMRCGGCGAKVGSTVLSRVINRLQAITRDDIIIGLNDPDDAAVCEVPAGKLIVQSVDYFRSFIDDPFIFGQIAANHARDIFAMGAEAQSAMAIATIPYGIESQIEDQLFQTMSGALDVLNASNTALVGGHSSEGAELSFGLSVTGLADRDQVMRKSGMQSGDVLILTKALGTGTLFAADMRLKAKGRWIDAALQSMLLSNQAAGLCMHKHGATACTDVTGFGLLGHLVEMTRASGKSIELNLDTLPILDGALEMIETGIFSSLQEQNVRLRRAIKDSGERRKHPHYPLLFDPQTSGGLLAAIPAEHAEACLNELKNSGYPASTIIGKVTDDTQSIENVTLKR